MDYSTVNWAVSLASEVAEANHFTMTDDTLRVRAFSWYVHTDITDIEMLAALALECSYDPFLCFTDLQSIKNYWFPQEDYCGETSIYDIEAAMADGRYFI